MGRVLPILFNTEMTQAVLYGYKLVTRRLPGKRGYQGEVPDGIKPRYRVGDTE